MNEEIKEIREYIACPQFGDDHYGKWGALRLDQRIKIKQLLDYITNLQQENERLEHENFSLREYLVIHKKSIPNELKKDKDFMEIIDMPTYEDYKSRCEKAIEYINNTTFFGLRSGKTFMSNYLNDLLNILQNGSEKDG